MNGYLNDLLKIVGADPVGEYSKYQRLLITMFNTDFWYDESILSDGSRALGGVSLRINYPYDFGDKPCSVLEMLIAMAIRIEETFFEYDPSIGDHPERWFWEMVGNLGLLDQTNDHFNEEYVFDILQRWMHRQFQHNGVGGLFPLRHTMIDQRQLSIWEQLGMYLYERHM